MANRIRQSLEAQVRRAGLQDSVRFEDRFVGPRELESWLAASDVFVTPYPNLDQIVSGTLAYAAGAGRHRLDAIPLRRRDAR